VWYAHNDPLGTPQALTDEAGTVVWKADYDPFGKATANEDPDGDGNRVTLNIRFPGQYYDQETGLHYNYFRYYDPATGRYITSDPIGLIGGNNTYLYINANPLKFVDYLGLCKCIAKGENGIGDKLSQYIDTWFGSRRIITCTYECTNDKGASDNVTGTHREWYLYRRGSDLGNEGDCLGAFFESMYSPYKGREVYNRIEFRSFDPRGSGAPELEGWADENCKDCDK